MEIDNDIIRWNANMQNLVPRRMRRWKKAMKRERKHVERMKLFFFLDFGALIGVL